MDILSAADQTITLTTGSSGSVDYVVAWADHTTSAFTPGSSQGNITTATTTTILAAPAASTQRQIKRITIVNRHATDSNAVRLFKTSGVASYAITETVTLAAGSTIVVSDGGYTINSSSYETPLTFTSGLTRSVNTVSNDLITGKAGGQTIIGGSGVTDALTYKGTTGNGTSTAGAHIFVCGNNGATEAFRVLNSGNVVVGATSTTYKFDVAGTVRVGNGTASTSTTTGDVVVQGGVGIGGALYADAITSQTSVVASGGSMTSGSSALAATAAITIRSAAGYAKQIIFRSGSSLRWVLQNTNTAEGGSDSGSDFKISAYNDSGSSIDDPLSFLRASGGLITIGGSTSRTVYFTGNLGVGTSTPTNSLSFGGNSARTIWMERHTTANTAGNSLTVQAGGATSGATDKKGGMLTLAPGISTNTGFSSVRLQGLTRAASTGTTDNTLVDRIIVPSEFNLTSGVAGSLFEVALPTLTGSGGDIHFSIFATDGTDIQEYTAEVKYALVNKGGVYTNTITEHDPVTALSTGTLTTSWAATAGTNKVTISVTATSSLTPTTFKIRYILKNLGGTAITQL